MPTIKNEPSGNVDDSSIMMNYEKGLDLNELNPQIVTIKNEPSWNIF